MKYNEYTKRFNRMQDNLPYSQKPQITYTARSPKIKIANLVYSSADYKKSLVYPGRNVYYTPDSGGFKIVIFKNMLEAITAFILKPIAQKVLLRNQVRLGGYRFLPIQYGDA